MLQNATPLRKSAPRPPLTSLMNMSLVLHLPRKMYLCRSSSNVPGLPTLLKPQQNLHVLLTFDEAHNPLHLPRRKHLNVQKSAPNPSSFYTFDIKMCFAPQGRALFEHLIFQKCSDNGVCCTFLLQRCALFRHLGSAPAALASLLFDPPGPIGKNTVFRDFSTFSRACIFFLLTLSLPTSAFSCVHIVGSLTSKLPSISARLSMGGPRRFPFNTFDCCGSKM